MSNVVTLRPLEEEDARTRQDVVQSLYDALRHAVQGEKMIPSFVREACEKKVWLAERVFPGGTRQPPITFHEFVHEPYPVGIRSTYDQVRFYLGKDAVALRIWDECVQAPVGSNQHSEPLSNIQGHQLKAPAGTTVQAGIRRLRKAVEAGDEKAATTLARVEAGEVSVNAAAIEMGWRKPTLTIVDGADELYAAAAKRLPPADMARRAWIDMPPAERRALQHWQIDNDSAGQSEDDVRG